MKRIIAIVLALCVLCACSAMAETSAIDGFRGIPWLSDAEYIKAHETEGDYIGEQALTENVSGLLYEGVKYGSYTFDGIAYMLLNDQFISADCYIFFGPETLFDPEFDMAEVYGEITDILKLEYGEPNADVLDIIIPMYAAVGSEELTEDYARSILDQSNYITAWLINGIGVAITCDDFTVEIVFVSFDALEAAK